jgi:hypothetical protein
MAWSNRVLSLVRCRQVTLDGFTSGLIRRYRDAIKA